MTREESRARTRSLLIEAAIHEIADKGFADASARDMAERAGFSQGAFYSNFPDKEAILLEVARYLLGEELRKLQLAMGDSQTDTEDILRRFEVWAHDYSANREVALVCVELQMRSLRSESFAKAYLALDLEYRQALAKLVEDLFARADRTLPAAALDITDSLVALARSMGLRYGHADTDTMARMASGYLRTLLMTSTARPAA